MTKYNQAWFWWLGSTIFLYKGAWEYKIYNVGHEVFELYYTLLHRDTIVVFFFFYCFHFTFSWAWTLATQVKCDLGLKSEIDPKDDNSTHWSWGAGSLLKKNPSGTHSGTHQVSFDFCPVWFGALYIHSRLPRWCYW